MSDMPPGQGWWRASDGRWYPPHIPPGWYPEPNSPGTSRYWDGAIWTEHRTTPPTEVVPSPASPPNIGITEQTQTDAPASTDTHPSEKNKGWSPKVLLLGAAVGLIVALLASALSRMNQAHGPSFGKLTTDPQFSVPVPSGAHLSKSTTLADHVTYEYGAGVSEAALVNWYTSHMAPDRPWNGLPWCDTHVFPSSLGNGVVYAWRINPTDTLSVTLGENKANSDGFVIIDRNPNDTTPCSGQ